MRHVWNAERFIAFDGSVNDVDRITAEYHIDQRSAWTLPVLQLVLAHHVDKIVLLVRTDLREIAVTVERLARGIDGADRGAVKIGVRRANVEDARFEQRLIRRHRELLIDEMGDPRRAGARY